MSGRFLLDTTAAIALFGREPDLQKILGGASEVFVSSAALGELYYGARKSARVEANLEGIDEFAAGSAVIVCDVETARHYGRIKHALRVKGRPIPENDIWIAAAAMQHGLTVLSRDRHFSEVDGLALGTW